MRVWGRRGRNRVFGQQVCWALGLVSGAIGLVVLVIKILVVMVSSLPRHAILALTQRARPLPAGPLERRKVLHVCVPSSQRGD
jgi:hypothetical protein